MSAREPKHATVAGEVKLELFESDTNLTSSWGAHVRAKAPSIPAFGWMEGATLDFNAISGTVLLHVQVKGEHNPVSYSISGGEDAVIVTCPHPDVMFGQPVMAPTDSPAIYLVANYSGKGEVSA
jgi:hypothetical protein